MTFANTTTNFAPTKAIKDVTSLKVRNLRATPKNHRTHEYFEHKLSNGLRVILVPVVGVRSVTALTLVDTGSRYEPANWGGISHFLEHMVFKGTKKFPTAMKLAETLDAVGVEYNAFTSKEYTGFYVKSASKQVELALDVLSDMLILPNLKKQDLEKEKGVIVEEINMYLDTPARHIGNVFEQLIFKGTSLGLDVIGTKESVRSLTQQDFLKYMHTWYQPQNMVLVVSGDAEAIGSSDFLEKITRYFSKKSAIYYSTTNKTERTQHTVLENQTVCGAQVECVYKKTDQAHFQMGFRGITHTDPRRYALAVLSTLFGGNMSSRLFTEVREKRGLCYYVRSMVDLYHDTGVFGASAGVDPSRIEEAVKVVKEEFAHLLDTSGPRAITEKEVQKAKDYLIGSTALHLEDTESLAHFYGMKALMIKQIETPKEMVRHIEQVKLSTIQALAKKLILGKSVYFAMIGPFRNVKTQFTALCS